MMCKAENEDPRACAEFGCVPRPSLRLRVGRPRSPRRWLQGLPPAGGVLAALVYSRVLLGRAYSQCRGDDVHPGRVRPPRLMLAGNQRTFRLTTTCSRALLQDQLINRRLPSPAQGLRFLVRLDPPTATPCLLAASHPACLGISPAVCLAEHANACAPGFRFGACRDGPCSRSLDYNGYVLEKCRTEQAGFEACMEK